MGDRGVGPVGWSWCWLALAGGLVKVGAGELVEGWIEDGGGAGSAVGVVDQEGWSGWWFGLGLIIHSSGWGLRTVPIPTAHTPSGPCDFSLGPIRGLLGCTAPGILLGAVLRRILSAWQDDSSVLIYCWVDEDAFEEDGVEEFLEVVGGYLVETVAVLEEVEGLGQVLADLVGVGVVAVQVVLDGGELMGEAVLFFFEQFQGDCAFVVGLEESAALVLQVSASGGQGGLLDVFRTVLVCASGCLR